MTQIRELGYEVVASVISEPECDLLLASLASHALVRSRAGARHLLSLHSIDELANDPRLTTMAGEALGQSATPFRVTLFDKSVAANWSVVWHQDTALPLRARVDAPGWGPWSRKAGILYAHAPAEALSKVVALRIHLDESSVSNGPLRVIPKSHHLGVLEDEAVERIVRESTPVDCVVDRGGVIAMRPLIIHSSPRVRVAVPRRVLHIEYTSSFEIVPGVELSAA